MGFARSRQRRGGAAVGQPRIHRPCSSGYHLAWAASARRTPRLPRSTPVARHSHPPPRPFSGSGVSTALTPGAGRGCSGQAVFSRRARPHRGTLARRFIARFLSATGSIARSCDRRRQVTKGGRGNDGTIVRSAPDRHLPPRASPGRGSARAHGPATGAADRRRSALAHGRRNPHVTHSRLTRGEPISPAVAPSSLRFAEGNMRTMPSLIRTPIGRCIRSASALGISLLPALSAAASGRSSIGAATAPSGYNPHGSSRPYLAVIMPPPLRFSAVVAAPAELPRLTALEPIVKSEPARVSSPASSGDAVNTLPPPPVAPSVSTTGDSPLVDPARGPVPIRILPDELRREPRVEDFLPYFIFPGSNETGVPPSSASYRLR